MYGLYIFWSYLSSLSYFGREISIINRIFHTMLIELNSYSLDYKTILLNNE